jgi:hypothetical protein
MEARQKNFHEMANIGDCYNITLYTEPNIANIAKIFKISSYFPRFVTKEGNQMLMEEVSKDKLNVQNAARKPIPLKTKNRKAIY